MDAPERLRDAAINAAVDDADLVSALARFLRLTQDRDVVEDTLTRVDDELRAAPEDAVLRRARALLIGALSTAAYAGRYGLGAGPRHGTHRNAQVVFESSIAHRSDVALTRARLVQVLAGLEMSVTDVQRVALVALELMNNALHFALPPYTLSVRRDPGTTLVVVRDGSDNEPDRHAGAEAAGGLALVELTSES